MPYLQLMRLFLGYARRQRPNNPTHACQASVDGGPHPDRADPPDCCLSLCIPAEVTAKSSSSSNALDGCVFTLLASRLGLLDMVNRGDIGLCSALRASRLAGDRLDIRNMVRSVFTSMRTRTSLRRFLILTSWTSPSPARYPLETFDAIYLHH